MGNPAARAPEKLHAYLILDVLREITPGMGDPEESGYVPEHVPAANAIILIPDTTSPGYGTHSYIEEDGPIRYVETIQYIATGFDSLSEAEAKFGYGEGRLINLIAIGVAAETEAKKLVHEFADKVLEMVQRHGETGELSHGLIESGVQRLEKDFWTR